MIIPESAPPIASSPADRPDYARIKSRIEFQDTRPSAADGASSMLRESLDSVDRNMDVIRAAMARSFSAYHNGKPDLKLLVGGKTDNADG